MRQQIACHTLFAWDWHGMTFRYSWSLFAWGREHCCPRSSLVGVVGDTQKRTEKEGRTQTGLRRAGGWHSTPVGGKWARGESHRRANYGGATTIGLDATHPPAIGQGGGGGSWGEGKGGVGGWQLGRGGVSQRVGACARTTTTTCIPQGDVCVWGHGGGGGRKTISKREARMGLGPPAVASGAVLTACAPVSGACLGRGRGPRLSQNLWGLGVMSPPSLLCHAVQRPATVCASSWRGGGGGRIHPPSLVGPFPCEAWWPSLLVSALLC